MAKAKGTATGSEVDLAQEEIQHLKQEVARLEGSLESMLDIHERLRGLMKMQDPEHRQILASGLSSLPIGGDAWMAVMLLLEKARAIEHGAAKRPGISNDDRNFNTGRESALEDFAHILMQARAEVLREEGE